RTADGAASVPRSTRSKPRVSPTWTGPSSRSTSSDGSEADRRTLAESHAPRSAGGSVMPATDIAVVGYAQTPSVRRAADSEVQLLVPTVAEALRRAGPDRREGGVPGSGSRGCLARRPFA